jgi:hypothetical protein
MVRRLEVHLTNGSIGTVCGRRGPRATGTTVFGEATVKEFMSPNFEDSSARFRMRSAYEIVVHCPDFGTPMFSRVWPFSDGHAEKAQEKAQEKAGSGYPVTG